MPIIQKPLGHGRILWVGLNTTRGTFSSWRREIGIANDGVIGDMYRGMWRTVSGHDVDYIATDQIKRGDPVLNLRQITIADSSELKAASSEAGISIKPGMLRENLFVSFDPVTPGQTFSKLPPLSRLVIGDEDPKVLVLTEENGPCQTITGRMALHFKQPHLLNGLRVALRDRRGQMAMVRSGTTRTIRPNDSFQVFPPLPS